MSLMRVGSDRCARPVWTDKGIIMIGVTLSRSTMLYFDAVLLVLAPAEVMMVVGNGFSQADLGASQMFVLFPVVGKGKDPSTLHAGSRSSCFLSSRSAGTPGAQASGRTARPTKSRFSSPRLRQRRRGRSEKRRVTSRNPAFGHLREG